MQTGSYQAQQQLTSFVQPEHLEALWRDIVWTTEHVDGVRDFRDAELFFSAKRTKLQFKTGVSRPTLLDAMDYFQSYLKDVIDMRFVQTSQFYVDIGKETCSRSNIFRPEHAPGYRLINQRDPHKIETSLRRPYL